MDTSQVMKMDTRRSQACAQGMRLTSTPYYSRVRLNAVQDGDDYTVAAGTEVLGFGYAKGQPMTAGGFASTFIATPADTNLTAAGQTISGQRVHIHGLELQIEPCSSARLAKSLIPELSVQLSLNGGQTAILLGIPTMWPAGGGLHGGAEDLTALPNLNAEVQLTGFFQNGVEGVQNYGAFPEGLIWEPGGNIDSNLNIIMRAERSVTVTSVSRAEDNAITNATGVEAFTQPDDGDVFVDFTIVLIATVTSARSGFM